MVKVLLVQLTLLCSLVFSMSVFAQTEDGTVIPANTAGSESVTISTMEQDQAKSTTMTTGSLTGNGGGIPAFTMTTNANGGEDYSINLQILALMTMLGFLPAMVILMTSFTRIVVVMSILRQAMGLQQTPSNQVIIGIAIFLTFFIMSPVINQVNEQAVQPYLNEQISARQAFDVAQEPIKSFMLKQTRIKDLETFVEISGAEVTNPGQTFH